MALCLSIVINVYHDPLNMSVMCVAWRYVKVLLIFTNLITREKTCKCLQKCCYLYYNVSWCTSLAGGDTAAGADA